MKGFSRFIFLTALEFSKNMTSLFGLELLDGRAVYLKTTKLLPGRKFLVAHQVFLSSQATA